MFKLTWIFAWFPSICICNSICGIVYLYVYKFFINSKNLERHKKSETQLFCNPGCKGTFLEPGNKVSSEYLKQYNLNPANPKDKKFIHDMEKKRKNLFGNKKNILIDNFYENASKKYLDDIKKEGAVSLCAPIVDRPKI